MPIPLAAGMLVSAGANIIGGIMGMGSADRAAAEAAAEKRRLQAQLTSLENSRQAIINPYETTRDVSGLARNLSGMITNPYANLGVATQASKIQAEEADISLANTLDTLKETGASAGGATALAQAALKSKQGIASNIEQQEAANEKLRAQGEADMQRMRMAEAQRLQGIQISEAQRVQAGEAAGKQFMFGAREGREQQKIDRVAAQLSGAAMQEGQARANYTSALTGMIGGITSAAGSFMSAMGSTAKEPTTKIDNKGEVTNNNGAVTTNNALPGNQQSYGFGGVNYSEPQAPPVLPPNWGMPIMPGGAGTRYL